MLYLLGHVVEGPGELAELVPPLDGDLGRVVPRADPYRGVPGLRERPPAPAAPAPRRRRGAAGVSRRGAARSAAALPSEGGRGRWRARNGPAAAASSTLTRIAP